MAGIGMGGATTRFSPSGTMNTRVSAGDQASAIGGAAGGYDPYEFIKKLRRDKEQARREAVVWDEGRAERADFQANALSSRSDPNAGMKAAAEREALLASVAQSKAQYQPAPTKMLFGAGIIPGRIAETTGLSGAQRQAYLPQDAKMTGKPIGNSPAQATSWDELNPPSSFVPAGSAGLT